MLNRLLTYSITILTVVFVACSTQESKMSDLMWLQGSWQAIDDSNYYEVWLFDNNQLKGVSYSFNANQLTPSEYLTITTTAENKLVYTAQVTRQNEGKAIPFTLQHNSTNKWVFENKTHDFPQRITYFKQAGNFMRVVIDGHINNKYKKQEWLLKQTNAFNLR